jgi:hypothetical protein
MEVDEGKTNGGRIRKKKRIGKTHIKVKWERENKKIANIIPKKQITSQKLHVLKRIIKLSNLK